MRRYRLNELEIGKRGHFAAGIVEGARISHGGLSFHAKGQRTHSDEDRHVHDVPEVFCILQGKAVLDLDGKRIPVRAGDVLVIEPGENHHMIADPEDPTVNLWFGCDDSGHPKQYG